MNQNRNAMKKSFLALDVLRGLTVTMMIIVNNPGSWSRIFPPLRHAAWDGCTPCDLVFPFFLFCVGASMAFSLARYASLSGDALKKILKEGREFGVGTILSTQFLKHFGSTDDDYAKYILTWVVHNVADLKTSDVEFVFKTEAKSTETQNLFNDIKGLQKHHSIVKIGTAKPKYIEDKAFWELYKEIKLD